MILTKGNITLERISLFEPDMTKWSFKNFEVDFLENYASDRRNEKTQNDRLNSRNTMPMTDFFYFEVLGR